MAPREAGYIDEGDIVKIIRVEGGGTMTDGVATSDQRYKNKVGRVISNNGLGMCRVRFLGGKEANFWNGRDLKYATDKEREEFLRQYDKKR